MLGDGHIGLDLEAADNGGLEAFGRRFHLVQHAIDAVADAKSLRQRLEMNIRGAHFEGLDDERIDQLDERRIRFDHRAVARRRRFHLDMLAREVLDYLFVPGIGRDSPALPIILRQRPLDVRFRRDLEVDVHVQQVCETVDGVQVRGVGQGNCQAVLVLEDGHDPIFSGDVARDGGNDVIVNLQVREVNDFGAEMGGLGLRHVCRADQFVRQHEIDQSDACGLGFRS